MKRKKQHVDITTRTGNLRVQDSIPVFMERYGMPEEQATVMALRLESVGQLKGEPGKPIIRQSTKPKGAAKEAIKRQKEKDYSKPKTKSQVNRAFKALAIAKQLRPTRSQPPIIEEQEAEQPPVTRSRRTNRRRR